jgi:ribosome maturation factor RimP
MNAVARKAADLIEPILGEMGFELVDIEYLSERGRWVLRIYAERIDVSLHGGITIDECARISSEIGDLIEVKNVIDHEFILEVSSPGLNRPIRKEKDFIRALGSKIQLRTTDFIEGRRNYTGRLLGFHDRTLHLESDNKLFIIPLDRVEKAHTVFDFGD